MRKESALAKNNYLSFSLFWGKHTYHIITKHLNHKKGAKTPLSNLSLSLFHRNSESGKGYINLLVSYYQNSDANNPKIAQITYNVSYCLKYHGDWCIISHGLKGVGWFLERFQPFR